MLGLLKASITSTRHLNISEGLAVPAGILVLKTLSPAVASGKTPSSRKGRVNSGSYMTRQTKLQAVIAVGVSAIETSIMMSSETVGSEGVLVTLWT